MPSFELEHFAAQDGTLVVRGHWSDVRGLRFVRPALLVDGRQVLATLDHKPWAPDSIPWTASFPWDGDSTLDRDILLAVAPSVTVPLSRRPSASAELPDPTLDLRRQADEIGFLRKRIDALGEERDALLRQRDHAREVAAEHRDRADALEPAPVPVPTPGPSPEMLDAERDELRRERATVARDRERAEQQLAEAVADREAAIRSRDRIEHQRDAALAAAADANAERDRALVERDAAHQQLARTGEQPALPASVAPRRHGRTMSSADLWAFRVVAIAGLIALLVLVVGALGAL